MPRTPVLVYVPVNTLSPSFVPLRLNPLQLGNNVKGDGRHWPRNRPGGGLCK